MSIDIEFEQVTIELSEEEMAIYTDTVTQLVKSATRLCADYVDQAKAIGIVVGADSYDKTHSIVITASIVPIADRNEVLMKSEKLRRHVQEHHNPDCTLPEDIGPSDTPATSDTPPYNVH